MKRAETDWDEIETPTPHVGSATGVSTETTDTSDFSGSLWIPDPEQRRGWREIYVDKPKPGARPIGFKR